MSVAINGKTTGGCTGKGFMPGRSGNPYGRPRVRALLRQEILRYLDIYHPVEKDKTRLQVLLARLEKDHPLILLAYGFGKPDTLPAAYRPATMYPTHHQAGQPLCDMPSASLQNEQRAYNAAHPAREGVRETAHGAEHLDESGRVVAFCPTRPAGAQDRPRRR